MTKVDICLYVYCIYVYVYTSMLYFVYLGCMNNITIGDETMGYYDQCCVYVYVYVYISMLYIIYQGCMNNVTFGDETMGYYETVSGGAGAVRFFSR